MLYEKDSTYNDSIIFKEKPKYITNTLDSLKVFSIDNLKPGTYKLVAVKDNNNDFLFDPKNDKVGYVDGFIEVPKDTLYQMKLFKEELTFKVTRPKPVGETRIMFPFEGELEQLSIEMLDSVPDDLEYRITKDERTDSLYYWFKPKINIDSTRFRISSKSFIDTLKYRFREAEKDTMLVGTYISGKIDLDQNFTIENRTPFKKINTTLITIIDKDSIPVRFEVKQDTLFNRYEFLINLEEDMTYNVTMYPGALTDFYDEVNDTLNYKYSTRLKSDYGNLRMVVANGTLPMIAQLVTDDGEVEYERIARTSGVIDFTDVKPGEYYFRVIFDTNRNGKWDSGNFLLGTQPERVSYSTELIEIRANFDYIETLPLTVESDRDPSKN